MSDSVPLTIRLPKAHLERLTQLALTTRRSKSSLAGEALAAYLEAQEWQVAAISDAVQAADAGANSLNHAAVAAWLRSWGTDDELSRPR